MDFEKFSRRRARHCRFSLLRAVFFYSKEESFRLGLAIGRRSGRAHERNMIKRVCREWFRKELSFLQGRGGGMILSSQANVKGMPEGQLKGLVRKDLEQLSSILLGGMR